jgi:cell wall-associated NlpC family hydrolase
MRRLAVMVCWCAMAVACASTGAVPRPFPTPGAPATPVDASTPEPVEPATGATLPAGPAGAFDGYSVSSTALSFRGTPYRNGGADPAGFDCSGFVHYVFEQHGIAMPRDVRTQFGVGQTVNADALEPGDLVFFSTVAPGASHVGIVIGGDQFVHAPSSRGVVRVERLSAEYWADRFVGARRVN